MKPIIVKSIKVATIQQSFSNDVSENQLTIADQIKQAAENGVQLVILPELHNTLYFCQTENTANFDLSESIPGPSTDYFSGLAKQYNIVIVTSLFEKRVAGIYHNTAVVLDVDGSIAGCYRKMHIPDDPGFHEKFYFTPGDLGFTPIPTSIGKVGVLVCWDQWFPEAARLMALAGADILVYPTAIGWDSGDTAQQQSQQKDAWTTIQRSHAIANALPVVVSNRIGYEADPSKQTKGIHFWGNSFICGAQGEMLTEFKNEPNDKSDNKNNTNAENVKGLLIAEVKFSQTEQIRRIWPYLRDRRIDAYQGITKRFID